MRLLKIQGLGTARAEPDRVVVSLDVLGKAVTYGAAVERLNQSTTRLKNALLHIGLSTDQVKSTQFAIQTDTQYKDGQSIDIGFIATHQLRITVDNERESLNRVLDTLSENASQANLNLAFALKDATALHQQALGDAVQAARQNAQTIANAAGIQLGAVQEIIYGDPDQTPLDGARGGMYGAPMMMKAQADIEPQEIAVSARVVMMFELLDV